MKKLLITILLLSIVFAGTAYGLTYGADNYRKHIGACLSGRGNDPIYNHMAEVDGLIGAGAGNVGSGTIYYVDSATDGSTGATWATAVGTLQEGVDLCSAQLGDMVYVAENHEENITAASALDLDCEGITIIGFGEGENQPTISLITNAGAEMTISEADITLYNMRILGAYTGGVTAGIYINGDGDGTRILGCEFWETSATMEQLIMINVAADADALTIAGNRFIGGTSADPTSAIYFAGGSDKTVIQGNTFVGTWSGPVIDHTTALSTGIMITDNYMVNLDATAGKTIQIHASANGAMINNACYANGAGFALVGDAMFISPDNIAMQTENVEGRNYESMFGAFTGPVSGAAQDDNIKASLDLAHTDLDAIIADFTDYQLDHVAGVTTTVAADADLTTYIADLSALSHIMTTGADTSNYRASTMSLQALGTDTDALIVDVASIASSIAAMSDTGYVGTNTATSQTEPVVALLAGFGDDYFNTGWSMIITHNVDSDGSAPEGEIRDITDYTSATGTFTIETLTANLGNGDGVMVKRTEDLELDMPTVLGSAGTIRYVDSGTSGDGTGLTWENAYATLALAEAACAAGDVVYIADGHDEEVATGDSTTLNVANTTFIGLGTGDARPLITITDDGTLLTIDNAGITLKNIRFQSSVTACNIAIRVEDAAVGCTIEDCAFIDGEASTVDEFVDVISVDQSASYLTVRNCTYYSLDATGHTNTFIDLQETTIDSTTIEGCRIFGMFAEAPIYWGAAVPVNLLIKDNVISNTTSGEFCIEGSGNATGMCVNNRLYSDSYATMLDPGYLKCSGNIGADAID
ncbi:MAG: autotransporter outer membrane beta-barrel domain-containing protein, partial [Planctomycetota bacterium]